MWCIIWLSIIGFSLYTEPTPTISLPSSILERLQAERRSLQCSTCEGYVETDSNGVFYWVNEANDGFQWTHPSQPRTYSFASGDDHEDCEDLLTLNDDTKTLREWINALEADKHHFCASSIWHTEQRTDVFMSQFQYLFGDFTEPKYDILKGIVARICTIDDYEYNCNPKGTCNMGLSWRECESVIDGQEFPQSCRSYRNDTGFIEQHELIDVRQDMITCYNDRRNCNGGDTPSPKGGVVAFVSPDAPGRRVIKLCPIMMWLPSSRVDCRISDLIEQIDYNKVYSVDSELQCFSSSTTTIFHELSHFRDIADTDHEGGLTDANAIGFFMAGVGLKPTVAPTPQTTTAIPTHRPTALGACVDNYQCSNYASYIENYPSQYCDQMFGANGAYCVQSGICCPRACGDCTPSEQDLVNGHPSSSPSFDIRRYNHEITSWILPEWLNISWSTFNTGKILYILVAATKFSPSLHKHLLSEIVHIFHLYNPEELKLTRGPLNERFCILQMLSEISHILKFPGRIFIYGYHAENQHKNGFFSLLYFKAISHVMEYRSIMLPKILSSNNFSLCLYLHRIVV